MTKREAALKVVEAVREYEREKYHHKGIIDALHAFDAAPDGEEAARKTKAQSMADEYDPEFLKEIALEGEQGLGAHVVPILLMALRDDLKALAASVKERR